MDDSFTPVSVASAPPPPQARNGRVLEEAVNAKAPRHDWTKDEIREVYNTPLMELAFQAVGKCPRQLTLARRTVMVDTASREPSTDNSTLPPLCRCARS
jgi:hypothetical protein